MSSMIVARGLSKTYDGGFQALKNINLEINRGEVFALLGPNGAGKTTFISVVCGLVSPTEGTVTVGGYDVVTNPKESKSLIGLVPQEINLEPFSKTKESLKFTRGLFNKPADNDYIDELLKRLSLYDKRGNISMALSGGMRRRVLIAKALCHEPQILFLDEPTAGVDVELRADMWKLVKELKAQGVTIILTTHYIDEAEANADRVGIINNGELILVEQKDKLMKRMGNREVTIDLVGEVRELPESLNKFDIELTEDGRQLIYRFGTAEKGRAGDLVMVIDALRTQGIEISDLDLKNSSLEDIFVHLVREQS